MAEGKRPQERAQRRRGPDPGEQPTHPTVAHHVINAVGSGDHPRDQRRDLQVRVRPTYGVQRQVLGDQVGQPSALCQANVGASTAHETRFGSSKAAEMAGKP